ncbi:probable xyloglucan endotransglucosylase/hydrolase protein 32 [Amborella trichopoda]|nr:probable xyloglucan endotransglucosylase/hydrolase protein 32 [Amborella trichopoda]|eukprot:XP_006848333.2 probable xyloglucan endotransglucosylase/hydrolase protein 32 [Amborella trichopoda]
MVEPSQVQANISPPLPGIFPSEHVRTSKFTRHYANLWGSQHQNVSKDNSSVTLRIDRYSGSGFKSKKSYMYGFFNAAIKLQSGYTAGIITSFYLSNNQVYEGWHDEVDMEFLGTITGEPIKLQTNVYGNGTGDGTGMQGREQHFHLWFDPTATFHNYSILWSPHQILFLVDDIPIRRFPRVRALGPKYPSKPMSVYATIWDASDWATDGGKYKANYTYEPFYATYTNFKLRGCQKKRCSHALDSLIPPKPNKQFRESLKFVRENYMVYDYCQDLQRYPNRLPECPSLKRW